MRRPRSYVRKCRAWHSESWRSAELAANAPFPGDKFILNCDGNALDFIDFDLDFDRRFIAMYFILITKFCKTHSFSGHLYAKLRAWQAGSVSKKHLRHTNRQLVRGPRVGE